MFYRYMATRGNNYYNSGRFAIKHQKQIPIFLSNDKMFNVIINIDTLFISISHYHNRYKESVNVCSNKKRTFGFIYRLFERYVTKIKFSP